MVSNWLTSFIGYTFTFTSQNLTCVRLPSIGHIYIVDYTTTLLRQDGGEMWPAFSDSYYQIEFNLLINASLMRGSHYSWTWDFGNSRIMSDGKTLCPSTHCHTQRHCNLNQ